MNIQDLLGEEFTDAEPFGDDMQGSLFTGYIPDRSITYQPQQVLGNGLSGPAEDQQLAIYRDTRPLAVDELGQQGPFFMPQRALAHRAAGRTFPLNENFGPVHLDPTNPGMPERQQVLTGAPYNPGMLPAAHAGVAPIELIGDVDTVYYTASPDVGWQGY